VLDRTVPEIRPRAIGATSEYEMGILERTADVDRCATLAEWASVLGRLVGVLVAPSPEDGCFVTVPGQVL
jgi:hypothetical protein